MHDRLPHPAGTTAHAAAGPVGGHRPHDDHVDPDDTEFANPTKFVGPTYSQRDAEALAAEKGWTFRPDGGAWRRVVPSPETQQIIEIEPISWLVERGAVVVCAGGGGGTPVPAARPAGGDGSSAVCCRWPP
jgi:carbamate kinase